jgi:hypothetical protein
VSPTWEAWYAEGPWVWRSGPDDPPAPFWNANATILAEYVATGPPTFDAELIATVPFMGTLTLQAHEESDPETVTGTMVWSVVNSTVIDYNASRAIVDQSTGLISLKWGQPFLPADQPAETYTFVEETGVFSTDGIAPVPVDGPEDSQGFLSGWLFVPILPGVNVDDPVQLQQNIFGAPPVGAFAEVVWTGHYVPEPSSLVLLTMAAPALLGYVWRRKR